MILERIQSSADLRELSLAELQDLARELRERITEVVGRNGGHLASNLGVVELTLALYRTFDFPTDHLVFDVGHQCYAHKLLSGRAERFDTIRQGGGLSGYPNRQESPYDTFTTGHAGASISTALGLALADQAAGRAARTVAVVGDGSIGCGLTLEGLNHAGAAGADLLVILNDNQMCISGTVGALAQTLTRVRTSDLYRELNDEVRRLIDTLPVVGAQVVQALSAVKGAVKDAIVPDHAFEHFGFRCLGPVNGHNLKELMQTLEEVRQIRGPVMLHACTEKGRGFQPAVESPTDFHSSPPFENQNGKIVLRTSGDATTWSDLAVDALLVEAEADDRVQAITAAMPDGTGLSAFAAKFPGRFYDVGICESHAVALAAGLAAGGRKPVVAIYSTFLQRSYDQLYHELALNRDLPVVLLIDRAGLVGPDGATHQGIYDVAYLRGLPNFIIAAPADEHEMRGMLHAALGAEQPVAIRYPRDAVLPALPKAEPVEVGRGSVLREGDGGALLALGTTVHPAMEAAELLAREGLELTVASARFVKPLDAALLKRLLADHPWVVTLEEGVRAGGFGGACLEAAQPMGLSQKLVDAVALPDELIEHGKRSALLERFDLTAEPLAARLRAVRDEHQTHGTTQARAG